MKNQNNPNPALLYLILGTGIVCIGFSAIFVKIAQVPGPASAFYRSLIALIVLVPLYFIRKPVKITGKNFISAMTAGLFFALDIALWNTSLLITSAATATFLGNTSPIWVGLVTFFIFKEKLSIRFWLGLASAFLGVAFLFGVDFLAVDTLNHGVFFATGAGILYAAYIMTTQNARKTMDTLSFMTISIAACVCVLLIINFILGTPLTGYSQKSWAALIGLGLVSHLGGWLAINYALGHLQAAPASVTLLGQAVVTAILSIPILGESLGIYQIVGGFLILGGIYFANRNN